MVHIHNLLVILVVLQSGHVPAWCESGVRTVVQFSAHPCYPIQMPPREWRASTHLLKLTDKLSQAFNRSRPKMSRHGISSIEDRPSCKLSRCSQTSTNLQPCIRTLRFRGSSALARDLPFCVTSGSMQVVQSENCLDVMSGPWLSASCASFAVR
jgi:hypothetical protein